MATIINWKSIWSNLIVSTMKNYNNQVEHKCRPYHCNLYMVWIEFFVSLYANTIGVILDKDIYLVYLCIIKAFSHPIFGLCIYIHTYIYIYIYIYLCIYVCMYVCMYIKWKYLKKMSWEWFFLRIYKRILINLQECSMYDD